MDPLGQGGISTLPTTEGAFEMGAKPYVDIGLGNEMGQGVVDATGAKFMQPQTNVQRRAVTGQPEPQQMNPAQQQAWIGLPINIGIGKQPLGQIKLR